MMGTAQSDAAEGRAIEAAEKAIANPLIDDVCLKGAKGLIINITGGSDLTLYEVDEAANRIKQEVQEDANIIYGTTCDERLEGIIRVSIVATGIEVNDSKNFNSIETSKTLSIDNSVYQQKNTSQINNISPLSTENHNKLLDEEPITLNLHKDTINDKVISSNENIEANLSEDNEKIEANLSEENEYELHKNDSDLLLDDKSLNEIDNESESDSNVNISDETNEINIEKEENKETVRRLSLFDTLNESSEKTENTVSEEVVISKNEPVLNDEDHLSNDLTKEEIISSEEEIISSEFEPEEKKSSYDDLNQDSEEELLDIPTFLRRQAN
jgi:hypothetical protein